MPPAPMHRMRADWILSVRSPELSAEGHDMPSDSTILGAIFLSSVCNGDLNPRMRNSGGVSEGGKHPNFFAVTENDPGPAGGPGALPDPGMVCCGKWRE